jgi:hypothetical protein
MALIVGNLRAALAFPVEEGMFGSVESRAREGYEGHRKLYVLHGQVKNPQKGTMG